MLMKYPNSPVMRVSARRYGVWVWDSGDDWVKTTEAHAVRGPLALDWNKIGVWGKTCAMDAPPEASIFRWRPRNLFRLTRRLRPLRNYF